MPPVSLLDRKLIFVTGKGGVGKTTVAAALALLAAGRGKRTLVCEVDAKGDLADFYETGPIRFEEREIQPGLWAMSMDTEASLKQYLSLQLKMRPGGPHRADGPDVRLRRHRRAGRQGDRDGRASCAGRSRNATTTSSWWTPPPPATSSASWPRPQAINQLVQVGLVRQQTDWMLEILSDPATTGLAIVATPEEMPVNETIDLQAHLRTETTVDLAAIVVNRVLPELFGRGEEDVFDRLDQPDADRGPRRGPRRPGEAAAWTGPA